MFDEFICDLKIARKRSGLTQAECGHLIGVSADVVGQIERGLRLPTMREIIGLSLIYGKTFESFFEEFLGLIREEMIGALKEMPKAPDGAGVAQRAETLAALARRLEEETNLSHGA